MAERGGEARGIREALVVTVKTPPQPSNPQMGQKLGVADSREKIQMQTCLTAT